MLDNSLYHGLLCDSTCMSRVEMDILLHNVLMLEIMTYYWTSSSSKSSSTSSYTSVPTSISSWCVVLRYMIILRLVIPWLCIVVLLLRNIILRLGMTIWRWYLIELWIKFLCHHLFLHPISISISLSHQFQGSAFLVIVTHWFTKIAVRNFWHDLILLHHWKMIWIIPMCLTNFTPQSSCRQRVWNPCGQVLRKGWTFILMVFLCPS